MVIAADFTESKSWPAVLEERAFVRGEPAVYALLHEKEFGRLKGKNRILYIGSTGQLGGTSESARLRIYRYPNGSHARDLRERTQILLDAGVAVTLYWRIVQTKDFAGAEEERLIKEYMRDHYELPPFNDRKVGSP